MKLKVDVPCQRCGEIYVDDKVENVAYWQCSSCNKFRCLVDDIESLERNKESKAMKCPNCKSRRTHDNGKSIYCDFCKEWFVIPLVKGGQGRTVDDIACDAKMTIAFISLAVLLAVLLVIDYIYFWIFK